ncbi:MAG: SAF domain-containing protein [Actinomycetota bacterium]|nr:SAF domain-containing protein [Actinomycetota bacterium]
MTDLGTTLTGLEGGTRPGTVAGRTVRRRRGLPGGRAVLGGFLVALAAVGVFAAYLSATAGPQTSYVVVTRDVGAGEQLGPADLALVPAELPDSLRARAFNDPGVLVGATTLAPLRADELVQASSVVATGAPDGAWLVSFSADASRALGGQIKPGERIDVLATFGGGDSAFTQLVAADVPVVAASTAPGAIGSESLVSFTVALADRDTEVAVVHAAAAGVVSVVRATGASQQPPPLEDSYRPQPPFGASAAPGH